MKSGLIGISSTGFVLCVGMDFFFCIYLLEVMQIVFGLCLAYKAVNVWVGFCSFCGCFWICIGIDKGACGVLRAFLCMCLCVCMAWLSIHRVPKCTNWIKGNCDVFRQLLTSVVGVGKAIILAIRFTLVDTQNTKERVGEQESSGIVKCFGH